MSLIPTRSPLAVLKAFEEYCTGLKLPGIFEITHHLMGVEEACKNTKSIRE